MLERPYLIIEAFIMRLEEVSLFAGVGRSILLGIDALICIWTLHKNYKLKERAAISTSEDFLPSPLPKESLE
jgi:hypothetical protein